LAEGNILNLIRVYLFILPCLKVKDKRYRLSLFASFVIESKKAARIFLKAYTANQSLKSRLHQLYSQYYQNEGRQGNFRRDFKFLNKRTVLSYITELDDKILLAFLLKTGKDDIDSKDTKDGRTPLWLAAREGHEAVVKLLLETGKVDVDSKDTTDGGTSLWWAARGGHEAVVKLLQLGTK
jgi:Ankyrin repeats (3 copies)